MTNCYAQSVKKYQFISKREDAVIVKQLESLYPTRFTFIEVAGENIDRKKFKVGEFTYRLLMDEDDRLARWQSRERACEYVGEENIAKAERKVRKQVRGLANVLANGRMHPAYDAMKLAVERVVEHYTDDFHWYDVKMLGNYNPARFIWCVRTCGTNMYLSKESLEWARFYVDGKCGDKVVEFWVWNGYTFYKVDASEILGFISNWLPSEVKHV